MNQSKAKNLRVQLSLVSDGKIDKQKYRRLKKNNVKNHKYTSDINWGLD